MRNHQPCRVCDIKHTNPASSTLCPSCGYKEREENLRIKAEIEELEAAIREQEVCPHCNQLIEES